MLDSNARQNVQTEGCIPPRISSNSKTSPTSIGQYSNYSRVACFKGFDADSFSFNTTAAPEAFDMQFELMGRLLGLGIDCYGYATFTAENSDDISSKIARFVDRLQELDQNLPLRTIPLHIDAYTPVKPRLNDTRRKALEVQDKAIAAWNEELERRFSSIERTLPITEVPCGARYRH